MSVLGVGIIGLKNQGLEHLQALQSAQGCRLVALCDRDEQVLERAAALVPRDVRRYSSLTAMLGDEDVQAVVVALPHAFHLWAVIECVQAGRAVLKEKPLGRTVSESLLMLERAQQAGQVVYTGLQRRHHGTYLALKNWLVAQGSAPVAASMQLTVVPRASEQQTHTWRDDAAASGGGALMDLGYHAVDLLHFLLGPMRALSCQLWVNDQPAAPTASEDRAVVWARAGMCRVRVELGRATVKQERVELQWADGTVVRADRERVEVERGGITQTLVEADRSWAQTMVEQLEDFAAAVRDGHDSGSDPMEHQLLTQRFLESCYSLNRIQGSAGVLA